MSFQMDDDGNIVLDFDSVLLPEGEYYVHITSVAPNRKKNATAEDFPYLEFHYGVEGRVDGEEIPDELIGTDLMDVCSFNPKARWKLKQVLEAFTCQPWSEKEMTINTGMLVGLSAIAVVIHDTYNGVQRPKPSKVYNPDFVAPEPVSDKPSENIWDETFSQQ